MSKLTFKDKKDLTRQEIYDTMESYILENLDLSSRKMRDEANFMFPAWSEFQANQLGQQKALHKLLEFIQPLDQRK